MMVDDYREKESKLMSFYYCFYFKLKHIQDEDSHIMILYSKTISLFFKHP